MGEFKYIGEHAEVLDGGRPVEPGEVVKTTGDERLRDAGLLIETKKRSKASDDDKEGSE